MSDYVTSDLGLFGYRELGMAGDLLSALSRCSEGSPWTDTTEYLGDGIHVCFNRSSGNVFLSDEDYNVAMMNGDTLEDWFVCPYCGHEGFKENMDHGERDELHPDCVEYLEQIGVLKDATT